MWIPPRRLRFESLFHLPFSTCLSVVNFRCFIAVSFVTSPTFDNETPSSFCNMPHPQQFQKSVSQSASDRQNRLLPDARYLLALVNRTRTRAFTRRGRIWFVIAAAGS